MPVFGLTIVGGGKKAKRNLPAIGARLISLVPLLAEN